MSTVLMPYDRYKEAEKALAENATLRERLAAAERERDEALAQRNEAQGERNEAWRERDEAIRQRDGEHKIVVRYEMLTVQKELRALIVAQPAALAKARELVERARLNLSFSRQDAVPTAAEAESNRNSAFHNCFEALAAIDATLAGRAEV